MRKEHSEELQAALARISKAIGGDGSFHIAPIWVCDNPDCQGKREEAFPYHVKDKTGRFWLDLCNDCFDSLGCAYPEEDEDDNFVYEDEGIY